MRKDILDLKKLDLHNFGLWPNIVKLIVILVFGVVIFILGFFLLDLPHDRALSRAILTEAAAKETLTRIIPEVTQQKLRETHLQQLKAMLSTYEKQVPHPESLDQTLEDITKIVASNQLSMVLLKPAMTIQENEFYVNIPINLKVIGSYTNITHFMYQLASLDYYLYPAKFSLVLMQNSLDQSIQPQIKKLSSNDLLMETMIEMPYFSPKEKDKDEKKH